MANPHIQETAGKAEERAEEMKEMAEHARDTASKKFDELRENFGDFYDKGLEQARRAEAGLESCIRERPLVSVLIATGIGVGLGVAVASLLRRS